MVDDDCDDFMTPRALPHRAVRNAAVPATAPAAGSPFHLTRVAAAIPAPVVAPQAAPVDVAFACRGDA